MRIINDIVHLVLTLLHALSIAANITSSVYRVYDCSIYAVNSLKEEFMVSSTNVGSLANLGRLLK